MMVKLGHIPEVALGGCLLATACAPATIGADHQPLEHDDVADLPAGDATMSIPSGTYTVLEFSLNRCSCRKGDEFFGCGDFSDDADSIWLAGDRGTISMALLSRPNTTMTDEPLIFLEGGIDGNGELLAGRTVPLQRLDGSVEGRLLERVEGHLTPGGQLELMYVARAMSTRLGGAYDCDALAAVSAQLVPASEAGSCNVSFDCSPLAPHCVDSRCTSGEAGSPCHTDFHCAPSAPRCVDLQCQPLAKQGESCSFSSDCEDGLQCRHDVSGGRCESW